VSQQRKKVIGGKSRPKYAASRYEDRKRKKTEEMMLGKRECGGGNSGEPLSPIVINLPLPPPSSPAHIHEPPSPVLLCPSAYLKNTPT